MPPMIAAAIAATFAPANSTSVDEGASPAGRGPLCWAVRSAEGEPGPDDHPLCDLPLSGREILKGGGSYKVLGAMVNVGVVLPAWVSGAGGYLAEARALGVRVPGDAAAWADTLDAAGNQGAGVLVPLFPGLLDLLRRPEQADDRSDLILSQG